MNGKLGVCVTARATKPMAERLNALNTLSFLLIFAAVVGDVFWPDYFGPRLPSFVLRLATVVCFK